MLGNIKLPEVELIFVIFIGFLEFLRGGGIGTVRGNHLSACGEKRFGHTPADSTRATGHNNSLIFEIEIHDRWIGKKKERDNKNSTFWMDFPLPKFIR
jgi:hypothetical protein